MESNKPETDVSKRFGLGMVIAMWLIALGLATAYFNSWYEQQHNPNQAVNQRQLDNGGTEVVLKRNRQGHYVTNGLINGQSVIFMLDTGASDISIPANIAKRLNLKRGRQLVYQTANGPATGYATRLDSVAIGNIELINIRASINPNVDDNEILLGMSFLKHLEFSQRGDQLTLRYFE